MAGGLTLRRRQWIWAIWTLIVGVALPLLMIVWIPMAIEEGRGYANSQEPDWSPATPFLPDLVVRGDYARLVVPYLPTLNGHLMKACPSASELDAAADERVRRDALLDCFSGQITVSLDGEPLALRPDWYTDPARDLRGLLYMIPVQNLADGRHEVSVLTPPRDKPEPGDDPEQPFVIAFWR